MQTRYLEIDDLTDELRDALDETPADRAELFRRRFDYTWVHHENALEGVVLSFEEIHGAMTQTVVTDLANVTLFKKIRANFTALEMARAENDTKRFKFSVPMFQQFYETLFLGLDWDKGKFRRDIPLHRTYFHDLLAPEKIPARLDALVEYANGADFRALHPIKQAAVFGHQFMQVFPWSEASGPVGRLMSNILLMRAGYFPVVIHAHDRERYYNALKGTSPSTLRDLVVESMENSLRGSLKLLRDAAEGDEAQPGRAG